MFQDLRVQFERKPLFSDDDDVKNATRIVSGHSQHTTTPQPQRLHSHFFDPNKTGVSVNSIEAQRALQSGNQGFLRRPQQQHSGIEEWLQTTQHPMYRGDLLETKVRMMSRDLRKPLQPPKESARARSAPKHFSRSMRQTTPQQRRHESPPRVPQRTHLSPAPVPKNRHAVLPVTSESVLRSSGRGGTTLPLSSAQDWQSTTTGTRASRKYDHVKPVIPSHRCLKSPKDSLKDVLLDTDDIRRIREYTCKS